MRLVKKNFYKGFLKLTELFKTAIVTNLFKHLLIKQPLESQSILLHCMVLSCGNLLIQIVSKVRKTFCRTSSDNFDFLKQICLFSVWSNLAYTFSFLQATPFWGSTLGLLSKFTFSRLKVA